jgi:hypothetical protein
MELQEKESVRSSSFFQKPLLTEILTKLASKEAKEPEFVKLLLAFRHVVLRGYERESQLIQTQGLKISVEIFHLFSLADISKVSLGLFQSNTVQKEHLQLKQEFFCKFQDLILSPNFDLTLQ